MKKIPTVYARTEDRRHVTDEVTPGCEWVLAGEGTPTRKYDGVCVMRDEQGKWWARREVKPGKPQPEGYLAVHHDPVTGKTMGWEPIEQSGFHKMWLEAVEPIAAFGGLTGLAPAEGTYELIGPKINGNPEKAVHHRLERHAAAEQWDLGPDATPRDYMVACAMEGIEGIVWHHPDGRMAKLKVRDYPKGSLR